MKAYVYRYFWFTAGLFINSMGIALITKAALGTSPISSLPYVLSLRFPLSFGQFTFIINMFFILGQILLLRSRFQPLQLPRSAKSASAASRFCLIPAWS